RADTGPKHRDSVTLRNHNDSVRRPCQSEFIIGLIRVGAWSAQGPLLLRSLRENRLRIVDQAKISRTRIGQALRHEQVAIVGTADPYDVAAPAIVLRQRRTVAKAVKQLNFAGYIRMLIPQQRKHKC